MDQLRTLFPLVVVGIFALALGRMALGSLRQRRWPTVDGTLVQTRRNRGDHHSSSFHAQVSFRVADGQQVEAWAINAVGYETVREPGTAVAVAHDPRDPRRCYVRAPGQRSPGWTIAFAVGVLAFVLWILYVVV